MVSVTVTVIVTGAAVPQAQARSVAEDMFRLVMFTAVVPGHPAGPVSGPCPRARQDSWPQSRWASTVTVTCHAGGVTAAARRSRGGSTVTRTTASVHPVRRTADQGSLAATVAATGFKLVTITVAVQGLTHARHWQLGV